MDSEAPRRIILLLLTDHTNFGVLVNELNQNNELSTLIPEHPLSDSEIEEYMSSHLKARHAAAAAAAATETTRATKRKRKTMMSSQTTAPGDDETYLVYPEEEDVRVFLIIFLTCFV